MTLHALPTLPTPRPRPPRSRTFFYAALAAPLTLVALLRFLPFQSPFPLLSLESLAFWVLLPAYALAVVAFVRGHRRIATWLAMIAVVHFGWSLEWMPHVAAHTDATPLLTLLDANLLAPRPTSALADELLAQDADVLALQEVSDQWLALLDERGAADAYPFRVVEAHPIDRDYFGIAILSRRPFTDARIERLPGADFVPLARADLAIDGHAVRIYSIHTAPPSGSAWAALYVPQMDWLDARLQADLAAHDVVIATGDFNASPFSYAHRRLRALGMTEAHEAVGRGTATTWPNGVFDMPPMRLDHAYVHGAVVRSVRELDSISSDHSPLLVELGVR